MKVLVLLMLTSCAFPERQVQKKQKTVIEKLAECTERYFSQHGVDPSVAYEICEKIYYGR